MKKKASTSSHFVVVSNSKDIERSAKRWATVKGKRAKAIKSEYALVSHAYQANTGSKDYDLIRRDKDAFVFVRDKDTGRLISKFRVDSKKKNASVRKLQLRPRAGTISIKRILDAI